MNVYLTMAWHRKLNEFLISTNESVSFKCVNQIKKWFSVNLPREPNIKQSARSHNNFTQQCNSVPKRQHYKKRGLLKFTNLGTVTLKTTMN